MERRFKSTTSDAQCAVKIQEIYTLDRKGPAKVLASRMYNELGDYCYWMYIPRSRDTAELVRAAIDELRSEEVRLRELAIKLDAESGPDGEGEYMAYFANGWADDAEEAHRYLTERFAKLLREFK